MTSESHIQSHILHALGSLPTTRLFRNTVGVALIGRPLRPITFGLHKGSADLVGWHSYTIQPDDVGHTTAVFLSVEVKRSPSARIAPNQIVWRDAILKHGGIAGIVSSPEAALDLIRHYHPPP